jgi:hypothetical protein
MPRVLILCPVSDGTRRIDTGLIVSDPAALESLGHLLVACPHCGDCHAIEPPFLEGEFIEATDDGATEVTTGSVVLQMVTRPDGGYVEPKWVLEPIDYNKMGADAPRTAGKSDTD